MRAVSAPTLAEVQERMQRYLLDDQADTAGALPMLRGRRQATRPERGLAVYHSAYRSRLCDVLGSTFERTWAYLGDAEFDEMSRRYVLATPSTYRNLRDYGRDFPELLRHALPNDPEAAELAIMDWNLHRAFDVADAPVLGRESLARLDEDAWAHVGFRFHPSVSLSVFEWNVLEIWHALDEERLPPSVRRLAQPCAHLFWRGELRGCFRTLAPEEHAALAALFDGKGFASVCERISSAHPDAAALIGAWLARWMADGLLSETVPLSS